MTTIIFTQINQDTFQGAQKPVMLKKQPAHTTPSLYLTLALKLIATANKSKTGLLPH